MNSKIILLLLVGVLIIPSSSFGMDRHVTSSQEYKITDSEVQETEASDLPVNIQNLQESQHDDMIQKFQNTVQLETDLIPDTNGFLHFKQ